MTDEQRYILNLATFQKRIAEIMQTEIDCICRNREQGKEAVRRQIEYLMDDYFGEKSRNEDHV